MADIGKRFFLQNSEPNIQTGMYGYWAADGAFDLK